MSGWENWRKSSHSASGGSCVEIGSAQNAVGIRDTKRRDGMPLTLNPPQWASFLATVKAGRYDG